MLNTHLGLAFRKPSVKANVLSKHKYFSVLKRAVVLERCLYNSCSLTDEARYNAQIKR